MSYHRYSSGIETAEFKHPIKDGHKEYRFVVIRRPIPEDPSEQQLTLFTLGKYSYQVIVTNLELTPLNTWKFYTARAAAELIIKELKADYPLGQDNGETLRSQQSTFSHLIKSLKR